MTDHDLMQALRDCFAPGSRRNIVDSALVRSATVTLDPEAPGANIPGVPQRFIARVTLTAPGNDEAANAQLQAQIENRLAGIETISRSEVTLLPPLFSIL